MFQAVVPLTNSAIHHYGVTSSPPPQLPGHECIVLVGSLDITSVFYHTASWKCTKGPSAGEDHTLMHRLFNAFTCKGVCQAASQLRPLCAIMVLRVTSLALPTARWNPVHVLISSGEKKRGPWPVSPGQIYISAAQGRKESLEQVTDVSLGCPNHAPIVLGEACCTDSVLKVP